MCRFALVKSKIPYKPKEVLKYFAGMAKSSKALDGDWQGDGWGIAWTANNQWEQYKSLKPIWEDEEKFAHFPKTAMYLLHARSASLPSDRGVIKFNQPYVYKKYAFVFNGLLKGVRLAVSGQVGAEKIWHILCKYLDQYPPLESLKKTVALLHKNTREIQALNIGLADQQNFYLYNYFAHNPEYYQLQQAISDDLIVICSEKIGNHHFQPIATDKSIKV